MGRLFAYIACLEKGVCRKQRCVNANAAAKHVNKHKIREDG